MPKRGSAWEASQQLGSSLLPFHLLWALVEAGVSGGCGQQRETGEKGMEEEVEMCSAVSRCKEITSGLWGQCLGPCSGLSRHCICWPRSSFQISLDGAVEKLWELRFRMQNRKVANSVWASGDKRKSRGLCRKRTWLEQRGKSDSWSFILGVSLIWKHYESSRFPWFNFTICLLSIRYSWL